MKLYQEIARTVDALQTCIRKGDDEWVGKHRESLDELVALLPSGSGWDLGTSFDAEQSSTDKLVFTGSFHHMDETGYYIGWTKHRIIITPSLCFGFHVKVIGPNKRDIKDSLSELFSLSLDQDV